ncbi:hypothetical protein BXZ70DRAFT_957439 [Cristinia sonorae]|uniref:Uncharacterized protein n=1 Tax=Cristinia sonorae TaxID=1940300 RepID=A0A8K0UHK3_9AGAR|nr:hypothetical protein BXZ70DRAFT_957439 [Cristinia sonorae]
MRTNRVFYAPCLRRLLEGGIFISAKTPKNVTSFCYFILNHPEHAAKVRKLAVWGPLSQYSGQPAIIPSLEKVLHLLVNLERLTIEKSEQFFSHKGLCQFVMRCTTLKSISFHTVGIHAAIGMVSMSSPVANATVTFGPDDEEEYSSDDEDEYNSPDPILALKAFKEYLTKVYIASTHIWEADIVYPKVHTLSVGTDDIRIGNAIFMESFPNVRNMYWTAIESDQWTNAGGTRAERLAYAQDLIVDDIVLPTWKSLDTLGCGVSRAYSLAMTFPVRLWKNVHLSAPHQIREFHGVLADIKPLHLSMSVEVKAFGPELLTEFFRSDTVTHLNVTFKMAKCSWASQFGRPFDASRFFESLRAGLQRMPLVLLIVRFEYDFSLEYGANIPGARSKDPVETALHHLDTARFVALLKDKMPLLKHVCYCFGDKLPGRSNSLWAVSDEQGVNPVKLERDKAWKVLRESPFRKASAVWNI